MQVTTVLAPATCRIPRALLGVIISEQQGVTQKKREFFEKAETHDSFLDFNETLEFILINKVGYLSSKIWTRNSAKKSLSLICTAHEKQHLFKTTQTANKFAEPKTS